MTESDRLRLLTPRQRQVLDLMLTGIDNDAIARLLGMKRSTLAVHLQHLYITFDVRSRYALMAKLMVPRQELQS